jgi:hypothetical protein
VLPNEGIGVFVRRESLGVDDKEGRAKARPRGALDGTHGRGTAGCVVVETQCHSLHAEAGEALERFGADCSAAKCNDVVNTL